MANPFQPRRRPTLAIRKGSSARHGTAPKVVISPVSTPPGESGARVSPGASPADQNQLESTRLCSPAGYGPEFPGTQAPYSSEFRTVSARGSSWQERPRAFGRLSQRSKVKLLVRVAHPRRYARIAVGYMVHKAEANGIVKARGHSQSKSPPGNIVQVMLQRLPPVLCNDR